MTKNKNSTSSFSRSWLAGVVLFIAALACTYGEREPLYKPEKPTQYTAEVQTVYEVYVLIDEGGNVVDFESPYSYGVSANMRYVLRFWDVGNRMEGYGAATIYKIYTPVRITAINEELEKDMSEEQKAEIYARTAFPATEVEVAELTFAGGPEGNFIGTNLETGKEIWGYMDWREKEWEMHVCFYHDIGKSSCVQDFLVLGEEPFYNWP